MFGYSPVTRFSLAVKVPFIENVSKIVKERLQKMIKKKKKL